MTPLDFFAQGADFFRILCGRKQGLYKLLGFSIKLCRKKTEMRTQLRGGREGKIKPLTFVLCDQDTGQKMNGIGKD